jgi:hypothetical protein
MLYALDAAAVLQYVALVAAGAVEGAVLALGQAFVLRRELPRFDSRAWTAATAAAAALAWSIGLLPSTVGDRIDDVPLAAAVPAGVVLVTLLLPLGVAQWWVLRRYVERAPVWIWANVLAWPPP